MKYQITEAIPNTTDPADWAQRNFGRLVGIAEWNTIKSVYVAVPNTFYAHTGLRDRGKAWVKCDGNLVHPTKFTRYFVHRADNGSPDMSTIDDVAGTMYLSTGNESVMPVIADMAGWSSNGFATWMSFHDTVPAGSRGAADDPDGDGSGNLAEYAAGTNPSDGASRAGLYALQLTSATDCTALYRKSTTAWGVNTSVQWSPDLNSWAASGYFIGTVKVQTKQKIIETGTDYQIIQVNATLVAGGPIGKLFLRCVADATR